MNKTIEMKNGQRKNNKEIIYKTEKIEIFYFIKKKIFFFPLKIDSLFEFQFNFFSLKTKKQTEEKEEKEKNR